MVQFISIKKLSLRLVFFFLLILVSQAFVFGNKLSVNELIELIEAREQTIKSISIDYSYNLNPLKDCDEYYANREFLRKFADQKKYARPKNWKPLTGSKFVSKRFECHYLSDGLRFILSYTNKDEVLRNKENTITFDGKTYLLEANSSQNVEVYPYPVRSIPLYTDYALLMPPRTPTFLIRTVKDASLTLSRFLRESHKLGLLKTVKETDDSIVVEAFNPRKDNEYYDAARIVFDLNRGCVVTQMDRFSAKKEGDNFKRFIPDQIQMEDFFEVQNGIWMPKKIKAKAVSTLKGDWNLKEDDLKELDKETHQRMFEKIYEVAMHEFIIHKMEINIPLDDSSFEHRVPKGKGVFNRITEQRFLPNEAVDLLAERLKTNKINHKQSQ